MAGKTATHEENILNHTFRGVAFAAPSNVHIGLFTAAPTDAGGGTEVTGGSYGRAQVASGTGTWAAPSGTPRQISNSAQINFTTPTADWGTIVAVGAFSAASGGTLLYWTDKQSDGTTNISKIVQNGDPVYFPIGALIFRED